MNRFKGINDRYLDANLESTLYLSIYFPIMEMLSASAIAMVIWFGGGQVLRSQIDWGVLVAMLQYIPRFFRPILEISERYAILQAAMASSERIFELLDTPSEPTGGNHKRDRILGEIQFDHVWFAYRQGDWVLKDHLKSRVDKAWHWSVRPVQGKPPLSVFCADFTIFKRVISESMG
jgi:ABC-type multidrug transport system fused ATPase/permease subunit